MSPTWWAKSTGRPDGRIRQGAVVEAAALLDTASETELREHIRRLARRYRWELYFTFRSEHSPAGYPDCTLVRPPRVIFAELKKADGVVSRAQYKWLGLLGRCPGVETAVWRPRDRDAIERLLR